MGSRLSPPLARWFIAYKLQSLKTVLDDKSAVCRIYVDDIGVKVAKPDDIPILRNLFDKLLSPLVVEWSSEYGLMDIKYGRKFLTDRFNNRGRMLRMDGTLELPRGMLRSVRRNEVIRILEREQGSELLDMPGVTRSWMKCNPNKSNRVGSHLGIVHTFENCRQCELVKEAIDYVRKPKPEIKPLRLTWCPYVDSWKAKRLLRKVLDVFETIHGLRPSVWWKVSSSKAMFVIMKKNVYLKVTDETPAVGVETG